MRGALHCSRDIPVFCYDQVLGGLTLSGAGPTGATSVVNLLSVWFTHAMGLNRMNPPTQMLGVRFCKITA
jgi:hypothetical protein